MAQHQFLEGGTGHMGDLIRDYDWSKTAVGPIDKWHLSMRTLVRMMLTSKFPMLIFWTKDLVTFYNDAFQPSLGHEDGKHPSSLGRMGKDSWEESWDTIGPMIDGIMKGGEAVYFENQKLPIWRQGKMGYAHWTYSFSPLTDDDGSVNGVLVTCLETTDTVEHLESLKQSRG